MALTLRKAHPQDRFQLFEVEKKSTPGLVYLPYVFDQFVSDPRGELIVAEDGGQLVACGKFSRMPDGSAWLETLRVIPERQGQGIGKRFYERFFELGRACGVPAMRMYTNIDNHASKGLAESFGFSVAATYRGVKCVASLGQYDPPDFSPVNDPDEAARLLLARREAWGNFIVLNRTWYAFSPALAAHLAERGMIYHAPGERDSLVVMGARFMPEHGLHVGLLAGDLSGGLTFALGRAASGVQKFHCLYPVTAEPVAAALAAPEFEPERSDFIVMEIRLN